MMLLPFHDEITIRPRDTVSRSIHINQDTFGRLRHLRIYERLLTTSESQIGAKIPHETWEVVRDALIDGREDAAQEIVTGAVGPWRPSMVIVHSFIDHGSQRYLQDREAMAHALWNVDLDHPVVPNGAFSIEIRNDEGYERTLRAYLAIDTDPPGGNYDDRIETIAVRIARVESAIRSLKRREDRHLMGSLGSLSDDDDT